MKLDDKEITVRRATADDAAMLLEWRNDPITRAMSLDSRPIEPERHAAWMKSVLENPDRLLLIAERDGEPVGQVRFDIEPDGAEISLTVAPAHRGKHLASDLIEAGIVHFRRERGRRRILAAIKPENEASKRAFARCGFVFRDVAEVRGVVSERWYAEPADQS